jgi:hypothetical protein
MRVELRNYGSCRANYSLLYDKKKNIKTLKTLEFDGTFDAFWMVLDTNGILKLMAEYHSRQIPLLQVLSLSNCIRVLHDDHISTISSFSKKPRNRCVWLERRNDLIQTLSRWKLRRLGKTPYFFYLKHVTTNWY